MWWWLVGCGLLNKTCPEADLAVGDEQEVSGVTGSAVIGLAGAFEGAELEWYRQAGLTTMSGEITVTPGTAHAVNRPDCVCDMGYSLSMSCMADELQQDAVAHIVTADGRVDATFVGYTTAWNVDGDGPIEWAFSGSLAWSEAQAELADLVTGESDTIDEVRVWVTLEDDAVVEVSFDYLHSDADSRGAHILAAPPGQYD